MKRNLQFCLMTSYVHVMNVGLLYTILLMLGTRKDDKTSDFVLDKRHFESYLNHEEYLSLAEAVVSQIGMHVVKDGELVKLKFTHPYPQYIYTRLASAIEKEIKHLL